MKYRIHRRLFLQITVIIATIVVFLLLYRFSKPRNKIHLPKDILVELEKEWITASQEVNADTRCNKLNDIAYRINSLAERFHISLQDVCVIMGQSPDGYIADEHLYSFSGSGDDCSGCWFEFRFSENGSLHSVMLCIGSN